MHYRCIIGCSTVQDHNLFEDFQALTFCGPQLRLITLWARTNESFNSLGSNWRYCPPLKPRISCNTPKNFLQIFCILSVNESCLQDVEMGKNLCFAFLQEETHILYKYTYSKRLLHYGKNVLQIFVQRIGYKHNIFLKK